MQTLMIVSQRIMTLVIGPVGQRWVKSQISDRERQNRTQETNVEQCQTWHQCAKVPERVKKIHPLTDAIHENF
jgi:hypothetical protein